MFTLLVTETPKGIKGRWPKLFGLRPRLEQHHTLDIPWRLIRAPVGKKGPDWAEISRLAGCHSTRLISSACHRPPNNGPIKLARLTAFQRILAARTICGLLPDYPYSATIGVIDPRARCLSAVEILLEKAGSIMVYTQLPHRYEWFAGRVLEQKGAAVVLCSSAEAFRRCSWVLMGGLCENWQEWVGEGSLVFSAVGDGKENGGEWLWGFEPDCPPRLLQQIPKGVAPADLCSALYQFAARQELAQLKPKCCRANGQLTPIQDLRPTCGPKSLTDRP